MDGLKEMAEQAGLHFHDFVWTSPTDTCMYPEGVYQEALEAFAKLVAKAAKEQEYEDLIRIIEANVAAEREACAQVCEEEGKLWSKAGCTDTQTFGLCATVIRARV